MYNKIYGHLLSDAYVVKLDKPTYHTLDSKACEADGTFGRKVKYAYKNNLTVLTWDK